MQPIARLEGTSKLHIRELGTRIVVVPINTAHSHAMPPKQDPIRSMQHVLVDLRYEKAYIFNNLIKCNFSNFTRLIPLYLGCPKPSPRSPLSPFALHCASKI